jgi:DNA polymerase elongation subunit (family B)
LLQLALKILANATYGFTGVGKTKGPMLGLQAISETTTFLGREAITLCHDRLTDGSFVRFLSNERPQLMASVPMSARVEVVYGDTDSLFFSWTEDLPMPLIFELGNESGDFLTNEVRRVYVRHTDPNNPFKVEHEKSGWGLYIRKKMYAMVKFEKIPDCERWETTGEFDDKNLMIRGLRPTRRDTFGLLRSKGKQILKEMLGWRPFDQASGLSRQEHRALVIKENVGRVMGTLNETIRVIMGSRTTDAEERKRLVPLF